MRCTPCLPIVATLLLAACERPAVTLYPADAAPERLSDWHVVHADGRRLSMNEGVLPYDLNVPLFSDYALKLRTVWMPQGTAASYRTDREFDFPVGTILSKTFHYRRGAEGFRKLDAETELESDKSLDLEGHRIVETRLLVRYEDGWKAFPYVWNDEQTEAYLEIAGAAFEFAFGETAFTYIVPDTNQCAACHMPDFGSKSLRPLGLKAHQLNRDIDYGHGARDQLDYWAETGRLRDLRQPVPVVPLWSARNGNNPEDAVRAYLDSNCAHCHNPDGPADTSGLDLSLAAPLDRAFGICKPPVAVGRGSGNRPYDIFPGEPAQSILLYRMEHDDPAIMMPELGRAIAHEEAVALIGAWIENLPGDC